MGGIITRSPTSCPAPLDHLHSSSGGQPGTSAFATSTFCNRTEVPRLLSQMKRLHCAAQLILFFKGDCGLLTVDCRRRQRKVRTYRTVPYRTVPICPLGSGTRRRGWIYALRGLAVWESHFGVWFTCTKKYVHVHVCAHACMYLCMPASCIHVRTCALLMRMYVQACIHVHTCACMFTRVHVFVHARMCIAHADVCPVRIARSEMGLRATLAALFALVGHST